MHIGVERLIATMVAYINDEIGTARDGVKVNLIILSINEYDREIYIVTI